MRKLMSLVTLAVIAALGWGGYWFVGASALERALGGWIDGRASVGWAAQAGTLATRGFPNRFDTTFEDLHLSDPASGLSWRAPKFQLLQLSYKPNHVIAVWPGAQVFGYAGQEITVTGAPLRASVEVAPGPALPLRNATIEAREARASTDLGAAALAAGQVSIRATPGAEEPNSYDLFAEATGLAPPPDWLTAIGAPQSLPERIETLSLMATVLFDKGWDISALEDARPQPRRIRVDALNAQWGTLALTANGTLTLGPDGTPSGKLALRATNWREIVTLAQASGKIAAQDLATLTRGLEMLASLKGDPETLDIPLGFDGGQVRIGPVPVMAAPKITLP